MRIFAPSLQSPRSWTLPWPDAQGKTWREFLTPANLGPCLSILAGLLLVFFGRRLFWLFVAVVGFFVGMRFAPVVAPRQSDWVILACGLFLGLLGALIALVAQRVAVAIAGAAVGAAFASRLMESMGWTDPTVYGIAVIAVALVAAVLASVLFDWALIIMTSLSGALMVCEGLPLAPGIEWAVGLALIVAGIVVQSRNLPPRG